MTVLSSKIILKDIRIFAHHGVLQQLYQQPLVTSAHLQTMLEDEKKLRRLIRKGVLEQLRSLEVTGRNLVLEEVLLDYVRATLQYDRKLLTDTGSEGFRIIGLEQKRETSFEGFRIKGFVDRMDSYRNGEVRIVDYKTGKVELPCRDNRWSMPSTVRADCSPLPFPRWRKAPNSPA